MTLKRIGTAIGIVGFLLALAPCALGGSTSSLLMPEGDLLVVEEVRRGPNATPVALRATLYLASGGRRVGIVPATRDRASDMFSAVTSR